MKLLVAQYSLFKQIMDKNCQMLRITRDGLNKAVGKFDELDPEFVQQMTMNSYKTIDCKLMHGAMQDLKRHKMMAKVRDDGFIFLYNRA